MVSKQAVARPGLLTSQQSAAMCNAKTKGERFKSCLLFIWHYSQRDPSQIATHAHSQYKRTLRTWSLVVEKGIAVVWSPPGTRHHILLCPMNNRAAIRLGANMCFGVVSFPFYSLTQIWLSSREHLLTFLHQSSQFAIWSLLIMKQYFPQWVLQIKGLYCMLIHQ